MPTSLVHYLCLLLLPINSLRLLAYALAFALSHCMHPLTGIASCIMWRQTALKAAVCHLCQLSTSEELSHLFLCPSTKSQSLRGTLWARGWGERQREGEEGGCSYWQMHSHSGRQEGEGNGGGSLLRGNVNRGGQGGGEGVKGAQLPACTQSTREAPGGGGKGAICSNQCVARLFSGNYSSFNLTAG